MDYNKFLKTKLTNIQDSGFDIEDNKLNKNLFDFQKYAVKIALKKGKYALFEDCGLGKTIQQIEWAYQITKKENKPVLIICPLAVAGQTIQEGIKFGYDIRKATSKEISKDKIYIINYEQLDNIDCSIYIGVVLDESSILKNYTGVYKNLLIETFKNTEYKLCCTATPSPNDVMELGTHSEFLNVLSRNEMLSTYFIHDGGETSKWKLKGHSINHFWDWVSQWAMMIAKPSDIGYSDDKYNLPKLNLVEKKIKTKSRENGKLFNDVAVNTINFNSELRITMIDRIEEVIEIINSDKSNFIVWVKHNEESDKLNKLINNSRQVKGSDSPEVKESNLLGFANNEYRVLITKSKIAQFGLNFQNCHNQIFASLDFSFESLYQSIRRSYRFGQKKQVNIYLITTDTMQNVISSIKEKQKQFLLMQKSMSISTQKNYKKINNKIIMNQKIDLTETEKYKLYLGDCCSEIKKIESHSVHLSIFSPPFADLYTYSSHLEDMGNSKNYNEFAEHFKFLIPELARVLLPGRIAAIHCMDLPIQKGKEGYIGLRDFSGMIIKLFQDNNFIYHSRCTIWKDPVIEMQRTKALGLLHKQIKKDSIMSRVGLPDYVLFFRNAGDNEIPIKNINIPVDLWQKWASPIWYDINYSDTLQKDSAREDKDEKHICPLQLPTIERVINLYSNQQETVFSPFAGIGSEGYQSIKMNRKFIGIELKESYYNQAKINLSRAQREIESSSLDLFQHSA